MDPYEQLALTELRTWQKQMQRKPSLLSKLGRRLQTKINSWIPDKVHNAITTTIKQMVRGVLFGATYTTAKPTQHETLATREAAAEKKINAYQTTAAVEGGITGAGGLLMGLADFPILIGIKLKLLFDVAAIYGQDVGDYRERLYLLHIFQLAFSSAARRKEVYLVMVDWDARSQQLPEDINEFDWQSFQQEYRDYIDIAKMAQLIPIIGAPIGAVVNYRLIKKLGLTAMNAYRMRLMENEG